MNSPVIYNTAFLPLRDSANNIPVVAPDTGKLAGMVSASDVLVALCEGASV